jgi:hypothetical protein
VSMATRYAQFIGAPLVVLHKRRISGAETTITHVVGEVSDRACLIVGAPDCRRGGTPDGRWLARRSVLT